MKCYRPDDAGRYEKQEPDFNQDLKTMEAHLKKLKSLKDRREEFTWLWKFVLADFRQMCRRYDVDDEIGGLLVELVGDEVRELRMATTNQDLCDQLDGFRYIHWWQ